MTPPHAPPEAPARPIIFLLGPPAAGKTALGSCAYRELGLDSGARGGTCRRRPKLGPETALPARRQSRRRRDRASVASPAGTERAGLGAGPPCHCLCGPTQRRRRRDPTTLSLCSLPCCGSRSGVASAGTAPAVVSSAALTGRAARCCFWWTYRSGKPLRSSRIASPGSATRATRRQPSGKA